MKYKPLIYIYIFAVICIYPMKSRKIDSHAFYREYHGHPIASLQLLKSHFRKNKSVNFIYLAGDSSLDNKHWLPAYENQHAVNGYEHILKPPIMKPDIAYHMNQLLQQKNGGYVAINAAVEESTLDERKTMLLPHDRFISTHITNQDILIVSLGGNDIALRPSLSTIWNLLILMSCNTSQMINHNPSEAWGMTHFINLFGLELKNYILRLIGNKRPKKIIICMIYYPDETSTGSWADTTLGYMGYNDNPKKLQAIIGQIFIHATSKIDIPDCQVIPLPMFEILNGRDTQDYIQRVEPSSIGGSKLAAKFVDVCLT